MSDFNSTRNSQSNVSDVLPMSNRVIIVVGQAETLISNPEPALFKRLVCHSEISATGFRIRSCDALPRTFLDGDVDIATDQITLTAHGYSNGAGPHKFTLIEAALAGSPGVIIDDVTDTLTRDAGSWLDEGFVVGQTVTLGGSASNNGALTILLVTDLVITTTEDITVAETTQTDLTLTAAGEALPAGLDGTTGYYVHAVDDNTFSLHTSAGGARNVNDSTALVASRVDITAAATGGVHTLGGMAFHNLSDDPPVTPNADGYNSWHLDNHQLKAFAAPSGITVVGTDATSVLSLWWCP